MPGAGGGGGGGLCGCVRRKEATPPRGEVDGGGGGGGKPGTGGGFLALLRRRPRHPGPTMPKAERTMKAALLIQRWYRRSLARMEVRRRYTWTIFQEIEYAGEQDQMKLYNFFNALLTHMPEAAAARVQSPPATGSSSEGSRPASTGGSRPTTAASNATAASGDEPPDIAEELLSPVDAGYKGAHIGSPLTRDDLDRLLDSFRKKKPVRLHARYVVSILREAAVHLRTLPNLNEASTAHARHVTVCGDLHGHLDDLLVIFHKNGLPSAENPYVFNGDFVDRGRHGIEVLLLLLACLLTLPGGVFLNRGNHEDLVMNMRYGFIREIRLKYKRSAECILQLLEDVYRWLPLGTIIDGRALAVHGGVSETTDVPWLKTLPRSKYMSLLRPPVGTTQGPGGDLVDKMEWKQVFDVLWSDPQPAAGCIPNKLRGAGVCFGPDVTEAFLRRSGLQLLLRSHECKPLGFELAHGGKVMTVFSASDYYELGSNKGAYATLAPGEEAPHFVQFQAGAARSRQLTFRQRVDLVEAAALRELRTQVAARRTALEEAFRRRDPEGTGTVTVGEWCAAMEEVTRLRLPWRLLIERLVPSRADGGAAIPVTAGGGRRGSAAKGGTDAVAAAGAPPVRRGSRRVVYKDTLTELAEGAPKKTLADTLYRNKESLQTVFRLIDKDHSGYITAEEFEEALTLLGEQMPGAAADLCRSLDMNKDGAVDLNEFLEAFRLVQMAATGRGSDDTGDADGDDDDGVDSPDE